MVPSVTGVVTHPRIIQGGMGVVFPAGRSHGRRSVRGRYWSSLRPSLHLEGHGCVSLTNA